MKQTNGSLLNENSLLKQHVDLLETEKSNAIKKNMMLMAEIGRLHVEIAELKKDIKCLELECQAYAAEAGY